MTHSHLIGPLHARHIIALTVLCLGMVIQLACEDRKAPVVVTSETKRDQGVARPVGKLVLGLDIERAQMQGGLDAPWIPEDAQVLQMVSAQLATSDSVTLSSGDAPHSAVLQYAALRIAPPQQPEKLALAASITFSQDLEGWQDARLERMIVLDPTPPEDAEKRAQLDKIIAQLVDGLIARQALAMIPDDGLIEAIEALDRVTVEQAHDVLARLRARHRASPYDGAERARVIALLEQLATREDPRLLTGVFAALREFEASGYGQALVEATAGASQRGEFPAFMALLAQMGEVNEPGVTAYLQSVATGHPDETIRQIASESLARHKERP